MARRMTPEQAASELAEVTRRVVVLADRALAGEDLPGCCAEAGVDLAGARRGVQAALRDLRHASAAFGAAADARNLQPAMRPGVAGVQGVERWLATVSANLKVRRTRLPHDRSARCLASAEAVDGCLGDIARLRVALAEIW